MKKLSILLLALFIFIPHTVLASQPPEEFDWSADKIMFTTQKRTDLPLISQGQDGFHLVWPENSGILYRHVDTQGSILVENSLDLSLSEEAVVNGFLTDSGYFVVWADKLDDYYHLYLAPLDHGGNPMEIIELDYYVPESPIEGPGLEQAIWIEADKDSQGNLHLIFTGGVRRMGAFLYISYNAGYELEAVHHDSTPWGRVNALYPARLYIGPGDKVWVTTVDSGRVNLSQYSQGERLFWTYLGDTAFELYGDTNNYYATRKVPPYLAVDDQGIAHLAWTHVTWAGLLLYIDVIYLRVQEDEIIEEKVITSTRGIHHFPTLTLKDDLVHITWEESMRSNRVLFYSSFTTDGEPVHERVRLNWGSNPSWLGHVYSDSQGELSAFWWGTGPQGTRLAMKSTHEPMEINLWRLAGLNPEDPETSLASQALYLGLLSLLSSVGGVVLNLPNLLILLALVFLLYKFRLLEKLLEQPWRLLAICLLLLLVLVDPLDAEISFPLGAGFQIFAALIASGVLVTVLAVSKYQIRNSLNLIFLCTLWLWLFIWIQYLPAVSHQVGM